MTDRYEAGSKLITLLEKALVTLETLVKKQKIEIPVQSQDMLDVAIGAIAEQEILGYSLLDYFVENPSMLFDKIFFESEDEFRLRDIMAEVLCFRVLGYMQEFLDEWGVPYVNEFDFSVEDEDGEVVAGALPEGLGLDKEQGS